jgi:hypothetical protein
LASRTISGVVNGKTVHALWDRVVGAPPGKGEYRLMPVEGYPGGDFIAMDPAPGPGFIYDFEANRAKYETKNDTTTGTAILANKWALCAKAIPGYRCLVLWSGFADLLAALPPAEYTKITWS